MSIVTLLAESSDISDEKLLDTLFVDDADGVDAVLYDTGPVDENSPGIKETSKIFDALSQVSERGTFGDLSEWSFFVV